MAVRTDFTAGEVLAAADLNDTFASKPPFAYGTATPSTTVDGFIWYDENDTPPAPKFWDGAAFQTFGGGKVLQVVRATDATDRTTTSGTLVDASISVTITPQKSTSAILLFWTFLLTNATTSSSGFVSRQAITDNSNNVIGGESFIGVSSHSILSTVTLIRYDTPATISAVTYKGRFSRESNVTTSQIGNATVTGQMYAIEVSA